MSCSNRKERFKTVHPMEYRIAIDPSKAKEFEQIIQTLKSLDVVKDFQKLNPEDQEQMLSKDPLFFKAHLDKTTNEFVNQYRDLVD